MNADTYDPIELILMPSKKVKLENSPLDELEDEGFVSLRPEKEKCQICFQNAYRYTCPGCSFKTCSLKCVNEHKVVKSCDGKQHQERYIPASQMDEKTVRKDVDFLNDLMRGSDNIKKRMSTLKKNQEQLRFKLLKIYAKKMHNIKIRLAPSIMTRHRENLSFYHTKSKKIFWSIEFKFCSFLKKNVATDMVEPCDEEIKIAFEPQDEGLSIFEMLQKKQIDDSRVLWYLQDKFDDPKLLENISCSRLYCYICDEEILRERKVRRLDWFVPFKDAIKDVTITEYPVVVIVSYNEFPWFERKYKVLSEPLFDVTNGDEDEGKKEEKEPSPEKVAE